MDLYTLTNAFIPKDNVDEFVSAIWTERYSTAGDVQLVVPATKEYIEGLADGTFLALRGSKEVMILETQSIENGLMTVIGSDLLSFLRNRYVWHLADDGTIGDYIAWGYPTGKIISDLVSAMVIAPLPLGGTAGPNLDLNWDAEKIPYLTLGPVDMSGPSDATNKITIPIGPLYDGISQVAVKEGLGLSLYLESADRLLGYSLKFSTYRGVDHTTDSAAPLVRLTPDLDSIQDLKEIRSIQDFKNVVYVVYNNIITQHLLDPTQPEPEGFDRRVLIVDASQQSSSYTNFTDFHNQTAKDAFANHNYIQAIDGQSSPISDYVYGVHYGLGDTIELEGLTGLISKARVTEFIRSQDKTGEKSYPTISVVT
jgi:hypothetical protein